MWRERVEGCGSRVEDSRKRRAFFSVGIEMEEEEAQLQPQEPQHYACRRETLLTLAHAFLHPLMNYISLPHF